MIENVHLRDSSNMPCVSLTSPIFQWWVLSTSHLPSPWPWILALGLFETTFVVSSGEQPSSTSSLFFAFALVACGGIFHSANFNQIKEDGSIFARAAGLQCRSTMQLGSNQLVLERFVVVTLAKKRLTHLWNEECTRTIHLCRRPTHRSNSVLAKTARFIYKAATEQGNATYRPRRLVPAVSPRSRACWRKVPPFPHKSLFLELSPFRNVEGQRAQVTMPVRGGLQTTQSIEIHQACSWERAPRAQAECTRPTFAVMPATCLPVISALPCALTLSLSFDATVPQGRSADQAASDVRRRRGSPVIARASQPFCVTLLADRGGGAGDCHGWCSGGEHARPGWTPAFSRPVDLIILICRALIDGGLCGA